MEELLPGVDLAMMRRVLGDLYVAHAETREQRLGNVFGASREPSRGPTNRHESRTSDALALEVGSQYS